LDLASPTGKKSILPADFPTSLYLKMFLPCTDSVVNGIPSKPCKVQDFTLNLLGSYEAEDKRSREFCFEHKHGQFLYLWPPHAENTPCELRIVYPN
jgi:hypothetical protein